MQLREVGRQFAKKVPPEFAEEWDNVGWMVGSLEENLEGIVACVDPSPEALEFAVENNCNLMLAHHPLFFESIKQLTTNSPLQGLVMDAVRKNVGIYAMHTNADSVRRGLNDIFADFLELEARVPLVKDEEAEETGLGRAGRLSSPVPLEELEDKVSTHPRISYFRTVQAGAEEISRVALCTGSGGDLLEHKEVMEADLFISGDLKHHEVEKARMNGLNLIILDHYEMETVFLNFAQNLLEDQLELEIPVYLFERKNPYLHYVNSNVQRRQEGNQ